MKDLPGPSVDEKKVALNLQRISEQNLFQDRQTNKTNLQQMFGKVPPPMKFNENAHIPKSEKKTMLLKSKRRLRFVNQDN